MHLNTKAWIGHSALAVTLGLLLFAPAVTITYWQAWVYLAIFLSCSLLITVDLVYRDPALLERRIRSGPAAEQRTPQKLIMMGSFVSFIALLAVPSLDHRFQWSTVPFGLVIMGDVLVVVAFYVIFRVYRVNTFSSATVEIAQGQHVISTGPYAIVRHPMYSGALLLLIGTPLALGSYWGLLALGTMTPCLVWRLFDEEKLLAAKLPGYIDYQRSVRRRLLPFVW